MEKKSKSPSPSAEELLRRIQELEALIKQKTSNSHPPPTINHLTESQGRGAEQVYGYTAAEVIGRTPTELLTEPKYASLSELILQRTVNGDSWSGQFPIKNKSGQTFVVTGANTPLRDDNGRLLGAMCVSSDSRPHKLLTKRGADEDSSIFQSEGSIPRRCIAPSPFGVFSPKCNKSSRAEEEWIMANHTRPGVLSLDLLTRCRSPSDKMQEASGLICSASNNSTSSIHDEILWEDLIIKHQIGQGSCGTVYRALWYGSDVAVKVFAYQEFSDDVILSFRQEVSLMRRLRHPNILLFMGAVTCSPQHLCIVTEFLPRGSLFQILQRNAGRLDWKRRLQMAIYIARGMDYIHHCNPPIVHHDLKSSNLLVDKNWTVKVGDFGLSRIKHHTYLKTKSGRGTPQWMALEIIRNEQADEKSDVYSYGVVLWEIVTEQVPWDDLNPMQVIAAVGFMNERLDIPKDVDPLWASLIESCWCRNPQSRPTFQEILFKLTDMKKKFAVERRK